MNEQNIYIKLIILMNLDIILMDGLFMTYYYDFYYVNWKII